MGEGCGSGGGKFHLNEDAPKVLSLYLNSSGMACDFCIRLTSASSSSCSSFSLSRSSEDPNVVRYTES